MFHTSFIRFHLIILAVSLMFSHPGRSWQFDDVKHAISSTITATENQLKKLKSIFVKDKAELEQYFGDELKKLAKDAYSYINHVRGYYNSFFSSDVNAHHIPLVPVGRSNIFTVRTNDEAKLMMFLLTYLTKLIYAKDSPEDDTFAEFKRRVDAINNFEAIKRRGLKVEVLGKNFFTRERETEHSGALVSIYNPTTFTRDIVFLTSGTKSKTDWVSNLNVRPIDFYGVMAHSGFVSLAMKALRDFQNPLNEGGDVDDIKKILQESPKGSRVILTFAGHSLGAAVSQALHFAMANEMAQDSFGFKTILKDRELDVSLQSFLVAPPRVFLLNKDEPRKGLQAVIDRLHPYTSLALDIVTDPVPNVPSEKLTSYAYKPLSQVVNSKGTIFGDEKKSPGDISYTIFFPKNLRIKNPKEEHSVDTYLKFATVPEIAQQLPLDIFADTTLDYDQSNQFNRFLHLLDLKRAINGLPSLEKEAVERQSTVIANVLAKSTSPKQLEVCCGITAEIATALRELATKLKNILSFHE